MIIQLHRAANEPPAPFVDHTGILRDSKTGRPINGSSIKDESEDEEEGRAAAFRSKKRKTIKTQPEADITGISGEGDGDEDSDPKETSPDFKKIPHGSDPNNKKKETRNENDSEMNEPSVIPRKKPGSFLDEILAERSKKKNNKKKRNKTTS